MIAAQNQVASDTPAGDDDEAPWSDTASDSKAEIKGRGKLVHVENPGSPILER